MTPHIVSVVIPCYQCGDYIQDTLLSIKRQQGDFEIKEIIIVDDNRDDDKTSEVLLRLATESLIRVIKNHHNQGASGARNSGIEAATGHWVAFLDSDDLWTEDSLQQRFAALERFPQAKFIGSDFKNLYADGHLDQTAFCASREIPRRMLKAAFEHDAPTFLERPLGAFLEAVPTHTCVVLADRISLLELGGFDESLECVEDVHLWIRLAAKVGFCFSPHIGLHYRQRDGSLSHQELAPAYWEVPAFKKLLNDPCCKDHAAAIHLAIAHAHTLNYWYYREAKQPLAALRSALGAIRWQPFKGNHWKQALTALLP